MTTTWKQCEIEGCPMHVARPEQSDERGHLCPGHAYALVMGIERGDLHPWLRTWIQPLDETLLATFLNACMLIAEGQREQILEWRRKHPPVRPHADRQS